MIDRLTLNCPVKSLCLRWPIGLFIGRQSRKNSRFRLPCGLTVGDWTAGFVRIISVFAAAQDREYWTSQYHRLELIPIK